jgi:hypothetical protein
VADTSSAGREGQQQREPSGAEQREQALGSVAQFRVPCFPPGPADFAAWEVIIEQRPDLAPAVEPELLRAFDGPSRRVDRLHCIGNGAVPAVVAVAFRTLCEAAGIEL